MMMRRRKRRKKKKKRRRRRNKLDIEKKATFLFLMFPSRVDISQSEAGRKNISSVCVCVNTVCTQTHTHTHILEICEESKKDQ